MCANKNLPLFYLFDGLAVGDVGTFDQGSAFLIFAWLLQNVSEN
jgi:hypothetical protein